MPQRGVLLLVDQASPPKCLFPDQTEEGSSVAYKPAPLPPELRSPDATVAEVMAYRRESARTVWRKIAKGVYRSHKNGDTRLIEWASVFEDRERCRQLGPQLLAAPCDGEAPCRKTAESCP
jgi:hypothetical protein